MVFNVTSSASAAVSPTLELYEQAKQQLLKVLSSLSSGASQAASGTYNAFRKVDALAKNIFYNLLIKPLTLSGRLLKVGGKYFIWCLAELNARYYERAAIKNIEKAKEDRLRLSYAQKNHAEAQAKADAREGLSLDAENKAEETGEVVILAQKFFDLSDKGACEAVLKANRARETAEWWWHL